MARNIKVLFLHQGGHWLRGSEYSLLSIMTGLNNNGYECELWANNDDYLNAAASQGIKGVHEIFPYFMLDPGDKSIHPLATLALALRIYMAIRKQGYDVIYCNGGLPAQAGYFAAKLAGIPIICHVRAPYSFRYIHLFNINRCDCTIFVSDATRDYHLQKARFKIPMTIHNGIDPNRSRNIPLGAAIPEPPDHFNSIKLGQISAIIKEKGLDTIIGAMKILSNENIYPVFYIAGKGEDLNHYREIIEINELDDQIFLIGEVTNISKFFNDHVDVNVLAAAWEEPFGRVIVEGYFEKKPAIGSIAGGIPEIIKHKDTGLLFERENPAELANCIRHYHLDRASIKTMGYNAYKHAHQFFSADVLVGNIDKAIKTTLKD